MDKDVIALTHICRAWREIFTSRSSLWTDFDCADVDKTRVYFERSKSSPIINLSLDRGEHIFPDDIFLEIVPRALHRLKSLSIRGTLKNLQDITAHLFLPAPHLEHLSIDGGCKSGSGRKPVLTNALFNGDLSSLRTLNLQYVHTELPWRNMSNLTSFKLGRIPPGGVSVKQLVDFFGGAPHLRRVELASVTPTSGSEGCRPVSLARLKRMDIYESGHSSLLFEYLLIPVGAKLAIHGDSHDSMIKDYLPGSLDNLRNLSNFTEVHLYARPYRPRMRFSGPNGKVSIIPHTPTTWWVLGSLTKFDTSKTERLEIVGGTSPSVDFFHRALLPMKGLRTLTLSRVGGPHIFLSSLGPDVGRSGVLVCPKLEELVLRIDGQTFGIIYFIIMAAATRASRGAKLKSIKIASQDKLSQTDLLELEKHVSHVECGPEVGVVSDESGSSDEED